MDCSGGKGVVVIVIMWFIQCVYMSLGVFCRLLYIKYGYSFNARFVYGDGQVFYDLVCTLRGMFMDYKTSNVSFYPTSTTFISVMRKNIV